MTATFSVKHAGVWKAPIGVHVRNAGIWKTPVGAFIKSAGVWQQYWPVATSGPTSWLVTAFTPGATRNNHAGQAGFRVQVGADQTVSWVGSRVASGNTGTHTVKLYDASGDVLLRTATIDMAGPLVNGYVWAAITPLALTMGSTYTLEKVVTSGGQSWFDEGATTIPNATIVVSVLRATSGSAIPTTANKQFVGLNLGW